MFDYSTSEQKEMRDAVRKLMLRSLPIKNVDAATQFSRELFRDLCAIGLGGLAINEEHGGVDADTVTTMIVMEELARHNLGPAIFISVHSMVSGLIRHFGNTAQHAQYLPHLASGKFLGAFALTEPAAGSDAAALKTSATKVEGGYTINGEKCYITSAGAADIYIVFARTAPAAENGKRGQGISAFIVASDAKGLSVGKPEKKMGCELSPIASLAFSEMLVPETALLGELHAGYSVALGGLAKGRINIAACANGVSHAALHRAVDHLSQRQQFGQALAEFQGLQFMLADLKMQLEAAELLTWQAAQTLQASPEDRNNRLFPSLAKCYATDTAMRITTDAVQLLGGAGYIAEYEVERLMREAKMLQIVEGTNQVQRAVIAREMLRKG